MVNETALALRKVIVNTNNKMYSLKNWEDAVWLYKWLKTNEENCHCVCLAFIGVPKDLVVMQKPEKYFWKILPHEFQKLLTEGGKLGQLMKLPYTTEDTLIRNVGEELYKTKAFPSKPPTKRNKRSGLNIEEEGFTLGNSSILFSSRE